jgi:hypothetical protein
VDGWLGAFGGEVEQATAPTTREHDCGGAARQIETGHDIVANHWETLRPILSS